MTKSYTHPKGKGAGKYNGMLLASDWEGQRVRASRFIRNNAGQSVTPGMTGVVQKASKGLTITFDACNHCGTVLHVSYVNYMDVEVDEAEDILASIAKHCIEGKRFSEPSELLCQFCKARGMMKC